MVMTKGQKGAGGSGLFTIQDKEPEIGLKAGSTVASAAEGIREAEAAGVDALQAERRRAESRLWRSGVLRRWADGGDRIAADFGEYDEAHPEVYEAFKRFALQWKQSGRSRASARDVLARVRWETGVNAAYAERGEFKVNNNYAAVMSRLLMEELPELRGMFVTRDRKSCPGNMGVCDG